MIAETRINRKINGQPAGWIGTRTSSLTLLKIFICSNLFSKNRYQGAGALAATKPKFVAGTISICSANVIK
jgi:hypothetical protein